jgi:hypothetical protein
MSVNSSNKGGVKGVFGVNGRERATAGTGAAIINSKLGSGRRVFKCELGKHKVKQMRPGVEGLIAG